MRAAAARRALTLVVCGALVAGCSTATDHEDAVATVHASPLEADVCFVEMMVPHHQQAVEMSEILLGKDGVWERGQRFARYVATTQGQEIEAMEGWLAAWDVALADAAAQLSAGGSGPRAVPAAAADGSTGGGGHDGHGAPAAGDEVALPSCGHAHGLRMDGMLTAEEMDSLRRADGAQAQRRYLELMIPHHEGALTMAEEALAEAENTFVVSSAAHVIQEQVTELESLRTMIAALDAGDLGLPEAYVDGEYLTYDTSVAPPSAVEDGAGPP